MIPSAQPESKYSEILEILNYFRITGDFNLLKSMQKKWSDVYKKDHYLKSQPLYLPGNIEPYYEFLRNHPDILKTCALFDPGLIDCFGSPLNVITEIMPGLNYEDNLVGWIQWYGDINDGMERYERFEDWFINKGYNLKSDFLHFVRGAENYPKDDFEMTFSEGALQKCP